MKRDHEPPSAINAAQCFVFGLVLGFIFVLWLNSGY